jgi:ubiquinone/menaquinone biosynthesis C-methylase UbiE
MRVLDWIESLAKSNLARRSLDRPALFNLVRNILAGGQTGVHSYIEQALDLSVNDSLVDMCCGTGDYAVIVPGQYVGVDLNTSFIEFGRKRYKDTPNKEFLIRDATQTEMPEKSFTYAFFISGLHHFPEEKAIRILKEINRITQRKVAVVDLVPDKRYPIRYLLTRIDRGDYVRPIEVQREIIQKVLSIQEEQVIISRLAILAVYICSPT